jgi:hypothetical protein
MSQEPAEILSLFKKSEELVEMLRREEHSPRN